MSDEDQLPGLEEQQPLRFAAYAGGDVLIGEAPDGFGQLLEGWGDRPVTAHDWKSLAASEDPSVAPPLEHDTMVAAYLIDPARRGYPLEELAEETGLGAKVQGGDALAERAVIARELAARQRALLEELDLVRLFEDVELPLVDLLVEMERAGVKLDVDQVRTIAKRVGEEAAAAGAADLGAGGRRVHDRLARSSWRPCCSTTSACRRSAAARRASRPTPACSRPSASEHEIIPLIEEWRELTKLKSTYLDAFPSLLGDDGRLRTTFNQVAAATGRLSSQNPNLQNIPIRTERGREIRACFVAEDGCRLISADYSQVELRLLAHIAGEDVLKEIFRRGEDVHTATAEQILGGKPDPGTQVQGQDGQLRDRLRPVGLRAGRPPPDPPGGGPGVHRPLPGALSRR